MDAVWLAALVVSLAATVAASIGAVRSSRARKRAEYHLRRLRSEAERSKSELAATRAALGKKPAVIVQSPDGEDEFVLTQELVDQVVGAAENLRAAIERRCEVNMFADSGMYLGAAETALELRRLVAAAHKEIEAVEEAISKAFRDRRDPFTTEWEEQRRTRMRRARSENVSPAGGRAVLGGAVSDRTRPAGETPPPNQDEGEVGEAPASAVPSAVDAGSPPQHDPIAAVLAAGGEVLHPGDVRRARDVSVTLLLGEGCGGSHEDALPTKTDWIAATRSLLVFQEWEAHRCVLTGSSIPDNPDKQQALCNCGKAYVGRDAKQQHTFHQWLMASRALASEGAES